MLASHELPSGRPKLYKKSDNIVELNLGKSSLLPNDPLGPEPLRESNTSYDLDLVSKNEDASSAELHPRPQSTRITNPTRAISFRDQIKIESHEREPILPFTNIELMDIGQKFNQSEM
jgi:hypothetical protein